MEQKKKESKPVTINDDTEFKRSIDKLSKFKDIKELEEDTDFIKDVEEALKLHDEGKVKRMNADAFLKELRKW
jgi:hypothetical protein